jgi:hypothetical protein
VCDFVTFSSSTIDTNTARIIGITERRTNTTVLVGSGTEFTCRGAYFTVPLRIDGEAF